MVNLLAKSSPFFRMLVGALLGIVFGIVVGLAFSQLIVWLSQTLFVAPRYPDGPFSPEGYQFASFFGMGIGAIVGGILGGTAINKK